MPFYGYKRPGAKVSEGVRNSFWLQGMMAGFPASLTSPQPTAGRPLPNAPIPKFSPCRPPSSPGAAAVIESIRAIFKKGDLHRTPLDINELIGDALALVRSDLDKQRIVAHAESAKPLPRVKGDRIQLQQLLF
jgi:hypothetical protein